MQTAIAEHRVKNTFFTRYPTARIDHIFVSSQLGVREVDVPATQLTRVASDHMPLVAEFSLPDR